jgi:heme oxygenase
MSFAIMGLRRATQDIHQRLHHHPAFAPLNQSPPDLNGYAVLLQNLLGFHRPLEAALFAAAGRLAPDLDDLPARRKAHLIEADLGALNWPLPSGGEVEPPATRSRPALLGHLYVTEGATLGGRDLGRRLEPSLRGLGLDGNAGRRFFLAYEPNQGAMWRRFCASLDAAAEDFSTADHQVMQNAARETFLMLEDWLSAKPCETVIPRASVMD